MLTLFLSLQASKAHAQQKIVLNDIRQINLLSFGGGLSAADSGKFEIVNESGVWNCYVTRLRYAGVYYHLRKDSAVFTKLNHLGRTLVKSIPAAAIEALLSYLQKPVPVFTAANLGLSLPEIRAQIDSGNLKGLSSERKKEFLAFIDTRKKLYRTLEALQKDDWTDDAPHCRIRILLKRGDTIQLDTRNIHGFMLPWMTDGKPDFDARISRFFAACIGDYPLMQQSRLNGKYIAAQIYEYIYYTYAREMFARENWQQSSPQNYTLLTRHFRILALENNFRFTLQPKKLPRYVQIFGFADIRSKSAVDSLISFAEDSVKRYINHNFVAKACREKNIAISFRYEYNRYANRYLLNLLYRKYRALHAYPFDQVVAFDTGNGNRYDNWLLLPDGKIVLTSYSDHSAPGVAPGILPKAGYRGLGEGFIEFSPDGKLVSNGSR